MIYSIYTPKDHHRGLYVTYFDDSRDFYEVTDFDLVLDEPSVPIDPEVVKTCAKLFSFLITGGWERDVVSFGKQAAPNTLTFGFLAEFRKEDALSRAVKLCARFLDRESLGEEVLAGFPAYDKAAEYVRTLLTEVVENGKYDYEKVLC